MARTKQTVKTSGASDSKKEEEKKRFDVEDRKEQELIDRRRQEALERSRRMEEQQRITKLQESKEKEDMEKSKRESEQSKLKSQEEKKKQKEEAERKQRVELELKKKIEDDKKRADDRRNKIEEERKKRIEEDKKKSEERRKAQEEELKRLEKLNADMLNNIANNDYSFLTSNNEFQTKSTDIIDKPSDFIDLLGGESDIESASDSESDGEYGISSKFQSRSQQQQRQDISRKSNVQPGLVQSQHRLAPQRGKIDELTDDYLDKLLFEVKLPLRKHGNRDGTYMYGMRIMKVTLINNRVPSVSAGKDNLSLEEFISKFEKVELTRRQGLESGLVVARMMMKNGNSITV